MKTESRKRTASTSSEDEDLVGPSISLADSHVSAAGGEKPDKPLSEGKVGKVSKRIRTKLRFEELYASLLPSAGQYEVSYMHRDVVTDVICSKSGFIVTVSLDGHLKFWKKSPKIGIVFVKHFRCHLTKINHMSCSHDGKLLCTLADDMSVKVFDIVNFDMINIMKLSFLPSHAIFISKSEASSGALVAIAEAWTGTIRIFDARGTGECLKTLDRIHSHHLAGFAFHPLTGFVLSVDVKGIIEYWDPSKDYEFPTSVVKFTSKLDTDLFELVKHKTMPYSVTFSSDGVYFAVTSDDRIVRIFNFASGKLVRSFDESLTTLSQQQSDAPELLKLDSIDFGRRIAQERELDKVSCKFRELVLNNHSVQTSPPTCPVNLASFNCLFDDSGIFLMYSSLVGIRVVNIFTGKCCKIIGKYESSMKALKVSLFQGIVNSSHTALTVEMQASDNPLLSSGKATGGDPILVCSGHKKNRFFIFSQREPGEADVHNNNPEIASRPENRDVFNERPTHEEKLSAATNAAKILRDSVIIHTTKGDMTLKLFPKECPKTVENFCTHASNGYYNGHLFHRVIKNFMIQTGDPDGDGTGGVSIWGGTFEDEFNRDLRHDRPFTVSMANAGPNTNGSQFFITVQPTPWLDNKHTVFGRVTAGMDVALQISETRVEKKGEKPLEDIRIINMDIP
eukprot:Sdes_comp19293_c0_seq1m10347